MLMARGCGVLDLTIKYNDKFGEAQELSISAKEGNDMEELATYINGQKPRR